MRNLTGEIVTAGILIAVGAYIGWGLCGLMLGNGQPKCHGEPKIETVAGRQCAVYATEHTWNKWTNEWTNSNSSGYMRQGRVCGACGLYEYNIVK